MNSPPPAAKSKHFESELTARALVEAFWGDKGKRGRSARLNAMPLVDLRTRDRDLFDAAEEGALHQFTASFEEWLKAARKHSRIAQVSSEPEPSAGPPPMLS
jgi:hypothetical protein